MLSVDEVCAVHAISRTALYKYARREGWQYRVGMSPDAKGRRARELRLGRRLLDALDRKLSEFECRHAASLASGAVPSAADAERDARTLNTLVRLFDKLKDLEAALSCRSGSRSVARAASTRTETPGARDACADGLRETLAQRLEALRG